MILVFTPYKVSKTNAIDKIGDLNGVGFELAPLHMSRRPINQLYLI